MACWPGLRVLLALSRREGAFGLPAFATPLAKIVCDGICADACGSCTGLFYFRRIITNFMIVLFLFLMLIITLCYILDFSLMWLILLFCLSGNVFKFFYY